MRRKKEKVTTSIGIAVSFDGSSKSAYEIVTLRSDSSKVTVTSMGSLSRDGIKFTPNQLWTETSEISGAKATKATMENGYEPVQ